MKYKKIALTVSLFVAMISCKDNARNVNLSPLIGLATPISIGNSATLVYLSDFFPEIEMVEKIMSETGIVINWKKGNDTMRIDMTGYKQKIGVLKVVANNQEHSILLKKTDSYLHNFKINALTEAKEVYIKGTFNSWNPKALKLNREGNIWTGKAELNAGQHQYVIIADGKEMPDPSNTELVSNGMGGLNSVINILQPAKKLLLRTESFTNEKIVISKNSLDKINVIAFWQNYQLSVSVNSNQIEIEIPKFAKQLPRSYIRVFAANEDQVANDILVPLNDGNVLDQVSQITRHDMHAAIIYNPMIDRFFDGNSTNNKPLNSSEVNERVDFKGGDVKGITKKIKDGYFQKLGINTLWISPVIKNPAGPHGQWNKPKTKFSGYHGYWPVSFTETDARFCTLDELKELIKVAHENKVNILLDYVAHHIHVEHPNYKKNPNWYTSLYLPDGTKNTEKWDEHRLTTWFDDFLPTFNFAKAEVVNALTDSALWWLENLEIDGFRHDATKHIPENFWRSLNKKIKVRIIKGKHRNIYQIGETYGSPELISSYLSTGMLDAQFDFNLYDAAVSAFKRENVAFKQLATTAMESQKWYGAHHTMGNITGNQDRPRFISIADGSIRDGENPKQAGWDRNIQIINENSYHNLQNLTAFLMSIPGIPVIYYGDEIGLPGANDPDSRRMMIFDDLSKEQTHHKAIIEKLIAIRKNNIELMYGETNIIAETDQILKIERNYFGKKTVFVFNKSKEDFVLNKAEIKEILLNSSGELANVYSASSNRFIIYKPK